MSDLRTQVPDSEDLSEQELLARTETKTYMANLKTQQVHLDRKEQTYARQKHIKSLQELADKNQKLGNKIFTGAKHESFKNALKILNINGSITVNPTIIQEHIISTTTTKLKHPEGPPKTGLYLPEDAPRNYPWGASQPAPRGGNTIDPFELETEATQLPARPWLHSSIQDEFAFAECIRNLKSGKAPGPDGVLNDIIKAAPTDLLATLHYFVQIMWATGCTPTSWKSSTLILLQKPNKDPLSFEKGYRKIGLENSLYKVWTSMVNQSMANFAEKHNILSNEQGGFRAHRSTQEQLELFTMLLEDARLCGKDIYLLQSDFTEAFDTINHDRLLQICYDLGFPTDAIEVVKNLYSDMTTMIKTPHGTSPPIPVDRGTIQGDSLSPFLFLVYLEPLLRWLTVGGRGYEPGSLPPNSNFNCAYIAYADDLNAMADNHKQLLVHAEKISQYATWGNLIVSPTKTSVTGILYQSHPDKPTDPAMLKRRLNEVTIQGHHMPFHDPTKPFTILGVEFTMNLNWDQSINQSITTQDQQCQWPNKPRPQTQGS